MAQWSIKIVELPDGTAAFQPDLPNAQPGQPLGAKAKDTVTWNNRTDDEHWPQASDGTYLTESIPAGDVSSPIFRVAASVAYSCKYHPAEKGSIAVAQAKVAKAKPAKARASPRAGTSRKGKKT